MNITVKNYIKTFSGPTANIQDTLGNALFHTKNSHDPVFVTDDKGTYLGAVSPHQTLYKHHFPFNTKVKKVLVHTPIIQITDTVFKIATYMVDTRLYKLPILTKSRKIKGEISARSILSEILKDKELLSNISKTIKVQKPQTASIHSKVKDIYSTFKRKNISRIIIVNPAGKAEGIVARSNIKEVFIRESPREHFSKTSSFPKNWSFDEEDKYKRGDPITKYYSSNLFKITNKSSDVDIIRALLKSKFQSIVAVDLTNKPTGIISYRNILEALSTQEEVKQIPLQFKKPSKNVSPGEVDLAMEYIQRFYNKLSRREKIELIQVSAKEPKYPNHRTAIYEVSVHLRRAGRDFVGKTKRKTYKEAIHDALKEVEKQESREHQSRKRVRRA